MVRRSLLALAIFLVLPLAAHAQQRKADAEAPKVLLDTERVRVTEVRVKPGAKFELKGQPYQFIYMLTDGSLVFSPPGKMPYQLLLRAGEVSLLPSQSTAENDGEARRARSVAGPSPRRERRRRLDRRLRRVAQDDCRSRRNLARWLAPAINMPRSLPAMITRIPMATYFPNSSSP